MAFERARVDVLELGLAVRVVAPFLRLPVRLERELEFVHEQLADLRVADDETLGPHAFGRLPQALGGPLQRAFRVAALVGLDQPPQRLDDTRLRLGDRLAPAPPGA